MESLLVLFVFAIFILPILLCNDACLMVTYDSFFFYILEGMTNISPIIPNHHIDEKQFIDIRPGGYWKPENCIARQRTAIIIPYRNRETHLHTLLHYIIPVLKRQLIEFRIFVPEQVSNCIKSKIDTILVY